VSGNGRENGLVAIEAHTELKSAVIEWAAGVPADPFAD
jgi:hypothetical protein